MDFIELKNNHILLRLHVLPGAKKNEIMGIVNSAEARLKIKIHAIAEDGKANAEIIVYLSKILKIPKSDFEFLRGHQSRQKDLMISLNHDFSLIKKALTSKRE